MGPCRAGDTIIDARKRFWVVDSRGLVVRGRGDADSLPDQARTPSGSPQIPARVSGPAAGRDLAEPHPWRRGSSGASRVARRLLAQVRHKGFPFLPVGKREPTAYAGGLTCRPKL